MRLGQQQEIGTECVFCCGINFSLESARVRKTAHSVWFIAVDLRLLPGLVSGLIIPASMVYQSGGCFLNRREPLGALHGPRRGAVATEARVTASRIGCDGDDVLAGSSVARGSANVSRPNRHGRR